MVHIQRGIQSSREEHAAYSESYAVDCVLSVLSRVLFYVSDGV